MCVVCICFIHVEHRQKHGVWHLNRQLSNWNCSVRNNNNAFKNERKKKKKDCVLYPIRGRPYACIFIRKIVKKVTFSYTTITERRKSKIYTERMHAIRKCIAFHFFAGVIDKQIDFSVFLHCQSHKSLSINRIVVLPPI